MPKRILLADDSITIQKVVELTFSDGDYEVTAVNNGTKAIQKLSEMRPDIILSDIIMPEKNGYEVCEFVKSHPEFRTIPVVLLTGTFEPFDPDRADKAGCDAVVTKPFESQSLIHKVEELIEASRSQAPTSPGTAAASPAPPAESPFGSSDQFATGAFQPQGSDIFGAPASTPSSTSEMPFESGAPAGGETRAFPRMSFDDMQKMANEPAAAPPAGGGETRAFPSPAAAPEASPWDQPPLGGGEAKAFPKMSFDDLQAPASTPPPAAPAPPTAASEPMSPWDEPAQTSGETRAFPRMSFEDLSKMASTPAAAPPPPPVSTPEPSPWDSGPAESSASTDMSTPFGSSASGTPPAPPDQPASPWDEPPAATGETKAFPRMSFEELQQLAKETSAETAPAPPPAKKSDAAEEAPFSAPSSSSSSSSSFSAPSTPERQPEAAPAPSAQRWADDGGPSPSGPVGELTEAQIDRIARRVVQLMSDQVVRNIAWEVIPDMAEMVVKERIRQLENET